MSAETDRAAELATELVLELREKCDPNMAVSVLMLAAAAVIARHDRPGPDDALEQATRLLVVTVRGLRRQALSRMRSHS